jgi:hypothetical protein
MCIACDKRVKNWKGDDPKCAFTSGVFSENWNCATVSKIRDICAVDYAKIREGVDYQYADDDHYATIKTDDINIAGRPLSLWVSWYKSRGSTQAMWLLFDSETPRRPTEQECLAISDYYT